MHIYAETVERVSASLLPHHDHDGDDDDVGGVDTQPDDDDDDQLLREQVSYCGSCGIPDFFLFFFSLSLFFYLL